MKTLLAPQARPPASQDLLGLLPLTQSIQRTVKAAMRRGIPEGFPMSPMMRYTSPPSSAARPPPRIPSLVAILMGMLRRRRSSSAETPRSPRQLSRPQLHSRHLQGCGMLPRVFRSRQPCSGIHNKPSVRRTMSREPKPFVKILMSY